MVRGLPSRRLARIVFGLLLLTLLLIVQGCTPPTVQRKTDRAAEQVPMQLSPGDAQLAQSFPIGTDLKDPSLPTTQEVWLQQIRGAQRSIDWAGFYIASARGEALDPVLVELSQAAAQFWHRNSGGVCGAGKC